VLVELIKSVIMEKLKMIIREATLVWRMEPLLWNISSWWKFDFIRTEGL